jgi:hypothetical protein
VNRKSPTNVAASVHQRLLNHAKANGRPFGEVLQYFGMERFLHRLSLTPHAESFVLKGALLFRVWNTPDTRATRDIDFLAFTENEIEALTAIVHDICSIEYPDDGLTFDSTSIEAQRIKEDADYEGVRIRLRGFLGKAIVNLQLDFGFGDTVHPGTQTIEYPTILGFPAPVLRGYPTETVIAEKTEAMIKLGRINSRMKDFYDVWLLSQHFGFDAEVLSSAIRRTLEKRKTEVMGFDALQAEILENHDIEKQWSAFLRKSQLEAPGSFADILMQIDSFLAPILSALKHGDQITLKWSPSGPWC